MAKDQRVGITGGGGVGRSASRVSTGMSKAPAKVQKGLDKTSNRVPSVNATAKLSNGKVKITENGFTGTSRGSNKAAAKGNVPKSTPGVKKNTSLQRSINNSNKNLKK
jgi:hypothetical protein